MARTTDLESITILRCVACLLVVYSHANQFALKLVASDFPFIDIGGATGRLGVEIFFMISGYLMIYVHWNDFSAGKTTYFLLKRCVRILPMYYFFTLLAIASFIIYPSAYSSMKFTWLSAIASFFFVPMVKVDQLDFPTPILSVGWTLCLEMMFYLLFSLSLIFSRKVGILFVVASTIGLVILGWSTEGGLLLEFYTWDIILCFTIGMLYGVANRCGFHLPVPAINQSICAILAATAYVIAFQYDIKPLLYPLTFAVFYSILSLDRGERVAYPRLLIHLGNASYSIYLCHMLLIGAFAVILQKLGLTVNGLASMFFTIGILGASATACGCLTYLWLERPMTRLFSPWVKRRSPQALA
ncbi:acyltransferase family protein [Halotalea alkalilenta]|uniref:acyltransferase family protein n=1 Tax=Halotalea alkalilenta TaxID=376489 RepID=UPI000484B5C8|nr:acyltransferase [Halotalea alkalilenta]